MNTISDLPSDTRQRILTLADHFGTPLYVYDVKVVARQLARFRSAFAHWPKTKIKYAVKALSNLSILRWFHSQGVGLDAVSPGEIERGLKAGFDAKDVLFTPNGAHIDEIAFAARAGATLNIDSIPLLQTFARNAELKEHPVCIRINPHIVGGGNKNIQVGGIDSKFGISIFMLGEAVEVCRKHGLTVHGLHVHTGSDILDIDVFLRSAEILFEAAAQFPDLHFIDFGSGFKVAYSPGEPTTDIEELGERLCARFHTFCDVYGRELEMWFEPGKFLVSEAGTFLTTVTQVKEGPAGSFAMTNSGFHQLLRPMLYDSYHHIENASNPAGPEKIYTVVGNLCETDTFASNRALPEVRAGDVLAFHNSGAYGFSMASQFNSRVRPAEVMVEGDSARLIREREKTEDLWAKEEMFL